MVTTEEMHLKSKTQALSTNATFSSPTVLLTEGNTTVRKDTRDTRPNKVCHNFNRGHSRFGTTCRFLHEYYNSRDKLACVMTKYNFIWQV